MTLHNTLRSKPLFAILTIIVAFFGGLNLFGIRGVWFGVLLLILFFYIFFAKRLEIRPILIFAIGFFASLLIPSIVWKGWSLMDSLLILVYPIGFFIAGICLYDIQKDLYFRMLLSLAMGYLLASAINLIYSITQGAVFSQYGLSTYLDIWGKASPSRTLFSIGLILPVGLSLGYLFSSPRDVRPIKKVLAFFIIALCITATAFVGNRSLILITLLAALLVFAYWFFRAGGKRVGKWPAIAAIILIVGVIFFWVCLSNNLFGIWQWARGIPVIERFITPGLDGGRNHQYVCFFEHWLEYPFGGLFSTDLIRDTTDASTSVQIHNTYLQLYSFGGWPALLLGTMGLVYLVVACFRLKWPLGVSTSLFCSFSAIVCVLTLFLFEPMITSEPFICSLFFLCAGHLYGEWCRQRNKRPLLVAGLSHYDGPSLGIGELLGKPFIAALLLAGSTTLAVFSDYGAVFSVISLLLLVLGFVLLDKADYSPASIVKTLVCLTVAALFTIFLNMYLPTNTWMYALAKSGLSLAVFLFLRIIVVSKKEEKDGYYRLRNFFTKLARDIDGSPEENLVSQDLQTNNEGE